MLATRRTRSYTEYGDNLRHMRWGFACRAFGAEVQPLRRARRVSTLGNGLCFGGEPGGDTLRSRGGHNGLRRGPLGFPDWTRRQQLVIVLLCEGMTYHIRHSYSGSSSTAARSCVDCDSKGFQSAYGSVLTSSEGVLALRLAVNMMMRCGRRVVLGVVGSLVVWKRGE